MNSQQEATSTDTTPADGIHTSHNKLEQRVHSLEIFIMHERVSKLEKKLSLNCPTEVALFQVIKSEESMVEFALLGDIPDEVWGVGF